METDGEIFQNLKLGPPTIGFSKAPTVDQIHYIVAISLQGVNHARISANHSLII